MAFHLRNIFALEPGEPLPNLAAFPPEVLQELLSVKPDAWRKELKDIRAYLEEYGARTPRALYAELDGVEKRLG